MNIMNRLILLIAATTININVIAKEETQIEEIQTQELNALVDYCGQKIELGKLLIITRDGWVLEQVLNVFAEQQKVEPIPHYIYLDYQRMVRIIDRHPEMNEGSFDFMYYNECMAKGF